MKAFLKGECKGNQTLEDSICKLLRRRKLVIPLPIQVLIKGMINGGTLGKQAEIHLSLSDNSLLKDNDLKNKKYVSIFLSFCLAFFTEIVLQKNICVWNRFSKQKKPLTDGDS